jgi:uncharacterized protein YjbI with pentapeptide repeats
LFTSEFLTPSLFFLAVPFFGPDFLGADFLEADFFDADFFDADFFDADFFVAVFFDADFLDADFFGAVFFDADFLDADFFDADFLDADFFDTVFDLLFVAILQVYLSRTIDMPWVNINRACGYLTLTSNRTIQSGGFYSNAGSFPPSSVKCSP